MEVVPLASKQDLRSGLDVTDVTRLMKEVEEFHGVSVKLVMSLDGAFVPYRLEVICVATKKRPRSMVLTSSVSRKRFFPTSEALTLEGLLFRLINEVDSDCGSMWAQEELWKSGSSPDTR